MTRPDLDAIRARLWSPNTTASALADDVAALLAYVEELTQERDEERMRTRCFEQAHAEAEADVRELSARITTLEAMKP